MKNQNKPSLYSTNVENSPQTPLHIIRFIKFGECHKSLEMVTFTFQIRCDNKREHLLRLIHFEIISKGQTQSEWSLMKSGLRLLTIRTVSKI